MTLLLEKAYSKLTQATEDEQERIAALILSELEKLKENAPPKKRRIGGLHRGMTKMSDDFVAPLMDDEEHDDWVRFSMANLAAAYGDDEPEYTRADIIEPNPGFEGDLWDKQIETDAASGKLDALAQEA